MTGLRRAALVLLLIGWGCAGRTSVPGVVQGGFTNSSSAGAIVTPDNAVVGTVSGVDLPGRFVTLSFPFGRLPQLDRQYYLYRRGRRVAEVWTCGPQTGDKTLADIVTGDAEVGDEARPQ